MFHNKKNLIEHPKKFLTTYETYRKTGLFKQKNLNEPYKKDLLFLSKNINLSIKFIGIC